MGKQNNNPITPAMVALFVIVMIVIVLFQSKIRELFDHANDRLPAIEWEDK